MRLAHTDRIRADCRELQRTLRTVLDVDVPPQLVQPCAQCAPLAPLCPLVALHSVDSKGSVTALALCARGGLVSCCSGSENCSILLSRCRGRLVSKCMESVCDPLRKKAGSQGLTWCSRLRFCCHFAFFIFGWPVGSE